MLMCVGVGFLFLKDIFSLQSMGACKVFRDSVGTFHLKVLRLLAARDGSGICQLMVGLG